MVIREKSSILGSKSIVVGFLLFEWWDTLGECWGRCSSDNSEFGGFHSKVPYLTIIECGVVFGSESRIAGRK